MSLLRRMGRGVARLLGWTLLSTVGAIAFGFVYGIVVLSIIFGHPLYWFAGMMLGPLAGAIGGPVFGVVYGAASVWRGRANKRGQAVLLAGALGGLIFAVVGIGFCAWETSERAHQPTKRPLPAPNIGQVVERPSGGSHSGGSIQATPDGGQVLDLRERTIDSGRSIRAIFTTLGVTALGGFLYGALFSALFGVKRLEGELP